MRSWEGLSRLRHDRDGTKLQALREMHRADRELAGRDVDLVAEFDRLNTALFDGVSRAAKLAGRADEDPDFLRLNSVDDPSGDPLANRLGLCSGSSKVPIAGAGPLNTDTAPRRSSAFPSTSAKAGGNRIRPWRRSRRRSPFAGPCAPLTSRRAASSPRPASPERARAGSPTLPKLPHPHPPRCARHPLPHCGRGAHLTPQRARLLRRGRG